MPFVLAGKGKAAAGKGKAAAGKNKAPAGNLSLNIHCLLQLAWNTASATRQLHVLELADQDSTQVAIRYVDTWLVSYQS